MGALLMEKQDPEKLVVVTSTPDGVAPLTPGERSMIRDEGSQVEQAAVVDHSYPPLADHFIRQNFDAMREAFADSEATTALKLARSIVVLQPSYLPAHVFEELAMNVGRGRDLKKCAAKCASNVELAQQLIKDQVPPAETSWPVTPEHVNEVLDMIRYNYSDRLMRLGRYEESLEQLRLSEMLPKGTEGKMKRRIKEASLLFRLKDKVGCMMKLKQARDIDRELFSILSERMSADGHAGVDQWV